MGRVLEGRIEEAMLILWLVTEVGRRFELSGQKWWGGRVLGFGAALMLGIGRVGEWSTAVLGRRG